MRRWSLVALVVAACGRVDFAHVTPVDATIISVPACTVAGCPAGYAVVDAGCYRLSTTPRAWLAAELDCEADGGHLVVTADVAEHYTLHTIAAGIPRVWLGWTDRRQDNVLLWVAPGGTLDRENLCVFNNGEPNIGDADHCIAQQGTDGCPDHFDDSCDLEQPYVCECDGNLADRTTY